MKNCVYKLVISGKENVISQLKEYLSSSYNSLSEIREVSRALETIYKNSIQIHITVLHVELSSSKQYVLNSTGRHRKV
jgi:hypothetical protein